MSRRTASRAGNAAPSAPPSRRVDAVEVVRAPGPVVLLIGVVVVLNVVGVVMVLSASSVVSLASYGSAWSVFERQLVWTAIGAAAFVVAYRVDYRHWQRWAVPLTVGAAVLCTIVLLPGIGILVGGSRRWLGLGWMRFQPSELAKLAVLVFTADLLARRHAELYDWRAVLRPALLVFGTLAALVYIEPDLDSTVVLALITAAVLIAGGVRLRHLAVLGGVGLGAVAMMAIAAPYRRARVFTFLHPTADASNAGYQIVQSLIALGSGGVTGVGLGAGRAKWHFLPNAHTDFVFSIIGEELGLIGCLAVLALFVGFAVFGIAIALRAPDRFGMLIAAGITVWVTAQAAINIGGVTGLLPVSGIPLPFVSFGGSSLVVTMLASGLLANVGRGEDPRGGDGATPSLMRRSSGDPLIIVTGGGTGGHVYPAIAVADELARRRGGAESIRFVGSARGLEATAVPSAGYAIDLLPGRGFRRSLTPSAVVQNIVTLVGTVHACVAAWARLRSLRPAVVLGVGGYAAAPTVIAARLLRIPVVVHEQNAAPGVVNRVAVALGARAAVSLPGTPLRGAVLTGNPVREAISATATARPRVSEAASPFVGVFGGSLGARRINDAVLGVARRWRDRAGTVIRHVTGPRDYQRCVDEWSAVAGGVAGGEAGGEVGLRYELVEYEHDMAGLYARADVVVTRAGAVTVAELAVSATPAVVVPLPGAPSDHQTANARVLAEAGAAVLVPDPECDAARLAAELDALLADPTRLAAMRAAAASLARLDAAARVADLVEEAAGVR